MTKFWIVNLLDKLFVSVAVFLLVFAWINFYVRDLWVSFVLSLLFSFAIVFLLYYFFGKRREKTEMSKTAIAEMNKCLLAFRLMKKSEQTALIRKLVMKENPKAELSSPASKKIAYKNEEGEHLIIIATQFAKIDDNELINLINENLDAKYDFYEIYCNDIANVNTSILKGKKIVFVNYKKLYEKLKVNELLPDTTNLNPAATKFCFKDFAKAMFLPQKAKSYFLCGLVLIFSSIILPGHLYYIIFGSMLMFFAILCKILKNKRE